MYKKTMGYPIEQLQVFVRCIPAVFLHHFCISSRLFLFYCLIYYILRDREQQLAIWHTLLYFYDKY